MRTSALLSALVLLACAGKQVQPTAPTEGTTYGRDAINPAIPKAEQSYSGGIEISDAEPTALISPTEGLVAREGHFRIARHQAGGGLRTVGSDGARISGELIRARSPRFGEPEVGTRVFYLASAAPSLRDARAADWEVGKVEGRDPILGKLVVSGHKVDPQRQILIPLDPLPSVEGEPARGSGSSSDE
jgi:hypothetical protein